MKTEPEFRRVTPHDLRHSAASLATSAGANVNVVQRMLGHKSAKVTLDTYELGRRAVTPMVVIRAIRARRPWRACRTLRTAP